MVSEVALESILRQLRFKYLLRGEGMWGRSKHCYSRYKSGPLVLQKVFSSEMMGSVVARMVSLH